MVQTRKRAIKIRSRIKIRKKFAVLPDHATVIDWPILRLGDDEHESTTSGSLTTKTETCVVKPSIVAGHDGACGCHVFSKHGERRQWIVFESLIERI